jgi:hypothetical protein
MAALAIDPHHVRNGQTPIAQNRTRRLLSLSLPEPHTGAAAILGDELYAGRFEGALDLVSSISVHPATLGASGGRLFRLSPELGAGIPFLYFQGDPPEGELKYEMISHLARCLTVAGFFLAGAYMDKNFPEAERHKF